MLMLDVPAWLVRGGCSEKITEAAFESDGL
jgi:hypothetical protein